METLTLTLCFYIEKNFQVAKGPFGAPEDDQKQNRIEVNASSITQTKFRFSYQLFYVCHYTNLIHETYFLQARKIFLNIGLIQERYEQMSSLNGSPCTVVLLPSWQMVGWLRCRIFYCSKWAEQQQLNLLKLYVYSHLKVATLPKDCLGVGNMLIRSLQLKSYPG